MKLFRFLLVTTLLNGYFISSFAQNGFEKKYSSKEESHYYDSISKGHKHKEFTPVSIDTAKKNPYPYCRVVKVNNPVGYSDQPADFMAYIDSCMKANGADDMNLNKENYKKFQAAMDAIDNDKVGVVKRMSIIKQGRFDNRWAILFSDSKYDDFVYSGTGYWLAISDDNGKTWNKYYTGLTEKHFFVFKSNSGLNLLKDKNTLQIEAVIVRQVSEVMHPMPAEFEVVQDSIALEINIPEMIKDSDNDGLTDIVEMKLLLDPHNPDTDGDGITDSRDKNPRFASRESDITMAYESILENENLLNFKSIVVGSNHPKKVEPKQNDSRYENLEATLLVTDDKDLQRINPKKYYVIIMTGDEYEKYHLMYPSTLISTSFSPLFRCDDKKDTFRVSTYHLTSGATYILQKVKKGWKIFCISSSIS